MGQNSGYQMPQRGNIRNGCALMMPCLCVGGRRRIPSSAHSIKYGPYTRTGQSGGALYPDMAAKSHNRILMATISTLDFDKGGKYSPHALRRGATEEIKNGATILTSVLKSGTWVSGSYHKYHVLQAGEAVS